MSAPLLPGDPAAGPSSSLPPAPATQRAREIQDALKSIVLQTASTLRARTQLARLQSSVPTSSASAAASVNETSSSLDKLTGECTRYHSLVHGLRDYLLHAQAALEIELEAATQREAQEAQKAAEAAAEALKRQQEAEEAAKKKAEEDAERKRIEEEERAKNAATAEDGKEEDGKNAEGKKVAGADDSLSGLATPPLPTAAGEGGSGEKEVKSEVEKMNPGQAANDAIVIDSDGDDDDEDDVPLAFAPKAGGTDSASKAIDLTDSPALSNAANPLTSSTTTTAPPPAPDASTSTAAPEATSSTDTAAGIPGLDLSAFGINLSSLTNLPDLSSLGIPSLTNAPTSGDAPNLPPATDFSELEKMMGMGIPTSNPTSSTDSANPASAVDLSSLGSFNLGSTSGGFGEDNDMFSGTGGAGLDLSNFDFSSLTGGAEGGSGGVDLSSFLTSFTSNTGGDGTGGDSAS